MIKPDWRCPICKHDVGPPKIPNMPMKCEHCETRLVDVKVIGSGVVFLHYRSK